MLRRPHRPHRLRLHRPHRLQPRLLLLPLRYVPRAPCPRTARWRTTCSAPTSARRSARPSISPRSCGHSGTPAPRVGIVRDISRGSAISVWTPRPARRLTASRGASPTAKPLRMICLRLLTLLRLLRLLRSCRLLRMVRPPLLRRRPLWPQRQVRRRLRPPRPLPLRAQAMAVWAVLRRMARLVTPRRVGVPQLALLSLLRLRLQWLLLLLPLRTLRLPLALIRRLLRVPAVRMAVRMAVVRARVTRAARVRTLWALGLAQRAPAGCGARCRLRQPSMRTLRRSTSSTRMERRCGQVRALCLLHM